MREPTILNQQILRRGQSGKSRENSRVAMIMGMAHRNYASVRHFTDFMLELNSRVVDMEIVRHGFVHGLQDRLALRGPQVRNPDVAAQRMGLAPKTPHV